MKDCMSARLHPLTCPFCEASELDFPGPNSARCPYCGGFLGGDLLKTLRQIAKLPNACGKHACEECAHPEMRCLPDGVYWCPACGSEVSPVSATIPP